MKIVDTSVESVQRAAALAIHAKTGESLQALERVISLHNAKKRQR